MSEKYQGTAASLREKMLQRYGADELNHTHYRKHKHNKNHLSYRQHFKSHPCKLLDGEDPKLEQQGSTGLIREFKLKKIRKRLDKGRIH